MIFWKKKDKEPSQQDAQKHMPEQAVPLDASRSVETEESSWFSRLSNGLSQSSQKLTQNVVDAVTKRPLDDAALEELEEALIMADLGPSLSAKLVSDFAKTRFGKQVSAQEIKQALADQIAAILHPVAQPLSVDAQHKPFVMLMIGVNGSGKTTTIGKLAHHFAAEGKKVVLAAGDTFRAAAVEQLKEWGARTGADVIAKEEQADSASVAFEALDKAKATHADIVMIDTAGRLHNKANLMEELSKIVRVIKKQIPDAPHAVLLTLDATIGQNALAQIEQFHAVVPLTGLVVTKLDGSARGGVVVAIADRFKLPIVSVGVGETALDLQPFESVDFSRSLLGL